MIACVCMGVRGSTVRAAVAEGATTVEAVGETCGAGTDCGSCHDCIQDLIDETLVECGPKRGGHRLPMARPAA